MHKKKKAFTLIEMVMYLGICSTIVLAMSISINFMKNYKDKLNIMEVKDSIHNFLVESKLLCKEENIDGQIYILEDKYIKFYYTSNMNSTKVLELKDDYTAFFNSKNITINRLGIITTAGTITIKNKEKLVGKITIKVGSEIIDVKE